MNSPVVMKPDERLIFRNNKVFMGVTHTAKYAACVEGKLVYRGYPMAEVAWRLERSQVSFTADEKGKNRNDHCC